MSNWNIILFLKSQYEATLDDSNEDYSNLPSPEKIAEAASAANVPVGSKTDAPVDDNSNANSNANVTPYYNSNIILLNGFIIALLKNCELIHIQATKRLLHRQTHGNNTNTNSSDDIGVGIGIGSNVISNEEVQNRLRDRKIIIELTLSQLIKHYI